MTREEHQQRHVELHRSLDELVADYITHTKRGLHGTSLLDFITWSHGQTINPTGE